MGRHKAYLRAHAPVGARDRFTADLFERHGVASHYTGCLTLTLSAPEVQDNGRIVACDLSEPLVEEVSARCGERPIIVSHAVDRSTPEHDRRHKAKQLLALYAGAKCVITSRLHCALPCLALGAPVLFIPSVDHPWRLQPAFDLCHWTNVANFLARRDGFDLSRPPPNPDCHVPLANSLASTCRAFVAAP